MGKEADVLSAEQRVMFSLLLAVSSSLIMDDHVVLAVIVGMCSSVVLFSPCVCFGPTAYAVLVAYMLGDAHHFLRAWSAVCLPTAQVIAPHSDGLVPMWADCS